MKKKFMLRTTSLITLVFLFTCCCTFGQKAKSKATILKSYEDFQKAYPDFSIAKLDTLKIVSSKLKKSTNVLMTISFKGTNLPPAFNLAINDKIVRARDDGKYPDKKAKDGIYTIIGKSKSTNAISTREIYYLKENQLQAVAPSTSTGRFVIKCHAHISTNCPRCTGPIFGGPCVICIVIDCDVTWESSWGDSATK